MWRRLALSAVMVVGLSPAAATAAGFSNIVVKANRGPGPGEVTLDWSGSPALGAPFAVFRSDNPATLSGSSGAVGTTTATTFADTPPAGAAYFYAVAGNGCAPSVTTSQRFSSFAMEGCAGSLPFTSRGALCASGCHVCSASEWVGSRGSDVPGHDYWTADALNYSGSASCNCAAVASGGIACMSGRPMRVCTPGCAGGADPEGNTCTWQQCGLGATTPNQYFGGCDANATAGALCCCP